MFPVVFDLKSLNGKNGFVMNAISEDEHIGSAVSAARDVNADGIDDIIIAAEWDQIYVVFGSKAGFPASLNFTNLNGQNGFIINGINKFDLYGAAVSSAGDMNDDSIADIIIGASEANMQAGQSYVIFGTKFGFAPSFNLVGLNGQNGFIINGILPFSASGVSVSAIGDINGDGTSDIIIGAPETMDFHGWTGQSYVIFGSKSGFTTPLNLTSINGQNGFVINGINLGDRSGSSVNGAGDVNGDGVADIIIGAPNANNGVGQSYVLFGNQGGFPTPFDLTNLNGKNGFAINGINPNDGCGNQVSAAGDVNGDGVSDVIIGAYAANNYAGQSYVIFGSKSDFPIALSLASLNGQNGFTLNGIHGCDNPKECIGDMSGFSVSAVGDVNNDGIADIAIGAPMANNGAGQSYIVFGSKNGFTTPLNLVNLDGQNGFAINGINGCDGSRLCNGDVSGSSISGAGDVNADGIDDIIIGAPGSPDANHLASHSYVIFGTAYPAPSPQPLSDDGLSAAAIGGIVGGVLGAAVLAGFAWYGKTHGWCCGEKHLAGTEAPLLAGE